MLKRKAKLKVDGKTLEAAPGYKKPPESKKKKAKRQGAVAAKRAIRSAVEPTIDPEDDHKSRKARPVRKTARASR